MHREKSMPLNSNLRFTRRELLSASMLAGGSLLLGGGILSWLQPTLASAQGNSQDPFLGGKQLGTIEFSGERAVPMEKAFGAELDGRLYTDFSALTPAHSTIPTEKFFIRTRASQLLDTKAPWSIRVGEAESPVTIPIGELIRDSEPQGIHLMECAGNVRDAHFGMMSVAEWSGVPVSKLADRIKISGQRDRVLISGFDRYATQSVSSVPGASWIFPWENLLSAGAFLATKMNGQPLTLDHGAPVRLVVPGWYGCTCIKWVNEISTLDASAEATSQMQEYAFRTHQQGVPKLAGEYEPATIDPAAMPIRIEKWQVKDRIVYRVVGIQWGGSQPVKALQIRFNPEEDYVAVDHLQPKTSDSWTFWTHAWRPRKPDRYVIRLHVGDPQVRTRRLDMGFYARTVEISEV